MTLAHPLRVLLVGAGSMGRAWRDPLRADPDVELVGIADIDPTTAQAAAAARKQDALASWPGIRDVLTGRG